MAEFKILSVDDAINILKWQIETIEESEKKRAEAYRRYSSSPAAADEISSRIEEQIRECYDDIKRIINRNFVQFPQHHQRHFGKLHAFYEECDYDKSVFIMTKFPDADDAEEDSQLQKVISCVEQSISECGYVPRLARGRSRYHDALWDNVELHLVACSRGIAIVEDKSKGELNPNVAMEWGFMRALGRPVLYLEEKDFSHHRADWSGLLRDQFSWLDPKPGIEAAIKRWLSR